MQTQNITFRIEKPLVDFLRRRAEANDRTLNGEIRSILRNLEKEKAPEHGLENRSDASHAE
ncbi:hypothetical protein ASY01nite_13810 [Acetobacter syzygii]|nr:hypothetical protein Absy_030_003 [Acetobacter syzygii]GBR64887.1 hypothetical protein AA0483_1584 [Acetobacter syzygii NRIC 0483]GEL56315.1 hypothetical protein ASY01nite_13810 [Acetobacter syzygii]